MNPGKYLLTGFLILSFLFPLALSAQLTPERRAELEQEMKRLEAEISTSTKLLSAKRAESASIQRDIDILTYEINNAKLRIRQKEIEINELGGDINRKVAAIGALETRLGSEKESLEELLRKQREIDDISLPEIILTNNSLSDLFADVDSFTFIQESLHQSFQNIRTTKAETETEKTVLVGRRNSEIDARQQIEAEKRTIESKEAEKKKLLALNKSQEATYESVIADRQRQIEQIRSALFELRNTTAISFGEAYDHAKFISAKTGIRPAFLLAILTQETNLGANVGTCNRPGDPETKSYKNIMKPERDLEPYLAIMKELGLPPEGQPLSCPSGGGWGGAMGPAQFIPSTWVMYKNRVAGVTGNNPPNPWKPRDAFTASALFLTDLGAANQTFTAERNAACRYYSGRICDSKTPANSFYGDSVMRIASGYQAQIDILQGN